MTLLIHRKAISEIMSQFLIISLVVLVIGAITVFLVPFIKGSFSDAKTCLDVQYSISIIDNRFSCYDSILDTAGIVLKSESDVPKEFKIALYDSAGVSTIYNLKDGPNPSGFGMFGNGVSLPSGGFTLSLPEEGQQLIYLASGTGFVRADVSPVVKGNTCPIDDSIELSPCLPSVNLNFVTGLNIDILAQVS